MSRAAAPKQPDPRAQDPADGTPVKEVAPFLRSLRLMLDTESPRILRWTPDGQAFEIHDMAAMTSYVLPKYFKHRKYASFQRQLNYFHFRKWTKSRAVVCTFSNQFFQRDQPALTWRITRKRALSPAKHSSPRSSTSTTPVANEPLVVPTQISKQLDPVVTVQTTVFKTEPKVLDEDASLAWIDVLYPELDLDLLENDSSMADCFMPSKLLSL
ncbi:putative HSF-type DNA-binding protein [Phytophthora cinnamomi]|uniref:putative HSF-type DNA-binding protein n=1 Tax=Phytophthora cinnamomi TaxID=4785 RepID=UPI00355969B2|nr:putative HSF-type DNA-binding protein [Phytophthora cinnamomi]